MRRVPFAGCAAIAALFAARSASAGASARLVYLRGPGAEQCPGEQAVRAAVATRLGYDPFFPVAKESLFVEVTRSAGAFHVELKLVDAENLQQGARSITVKGSDCTTGLDAMALTISLVIDPESVIRGPAPAPAPAPTPTPTPSPTPSPSPSPGPSPTPSPSPGPSPTPSPSPGPSPSPDPGRSPASFEPFASASFAASLGSAPDVAIGGRLSAGVAWRALSVEVEGRADAPATGAGSSGVQVKSWVDAVSLVPCLHLGIFMGCAVGSVGAVTATSLAPSPQTNAALWAAFGPRAGVEIPVVGALSVRAWVEGLLLVDPAAFFLDSTEQVYQLSPVEGSGGVGALFRFL